jgi:hypothetical protein
VCGVVHQQRTLQEYQLRGGRRSDDGFVRAEDVWRPRNERLVCVKFCVLFWCMYVLVYLCMFVCVCVRSFLMQAFGPHVDPFLDIQVQRLDAPFVYVTLTATTPSQEKPRTLDHAAFLPTLAGETDNYGVIYPTSRAAYANVNAVCAPLARAVKKVHSYMRLLSYPYKLERRRLDVLTGLIVGDETCVFMFPSQTARSASSHVIAV